MMTSTTRMIILAAISNLKMTHTKLNALNIKSPLYLTRNEIYKKQIIYDKAIVRRLFETRHLNPEVLTSPVYPPLICRKCNSLMKLGSARFEPATAIDVPEWGGKVQVSQLRLYCDECFKEEKIV